MTPTLQPADTARLPATPASVLLLDPFGALGAALCAHLADRPRLALSGADGRAVRAAAAEVTRVRALHGAPDAPLVIGPGADPVRAADEALGGLDALVAVLDAPPNGVLTGVLAALPEGARAVLVATSSPPGLGEAVAAFVTAHATASDRRILGVVALRAPRLGWTAPEGAEAYARAARAAADLLDGDVPSGRTLRIPVQPPARYVP